MSDDRPLRYTEDMDDGRTKIVYRASGFGGCHRAIVACAYGDAYPPKDWPEAFQKILDEGTVWEAAILAMHDAATEVPTIEQQAEYELVLLDLDDRLVVIRGHIDGKAGVGNTIREAKKIRDSGWTKYLRQGVEFLPNYPWQVAAAMHAMPGWDTEFIGGHLVVDEEGQATLTETHFHHITEPPIPFKAFLKRAAMLERLIEDGMDPIEVDCQVRYPCRWFYLHDPVDEDKDVFTIPDDEEGTALARMSMARWNTAQEELKAMKDRMADLEAVKKDAAEAMKVILRAYGEPADKAKKFTLDGETYSRRRYTQAEKVIPAYDLDFFVKDKPKKEKGVKSE